MKNQKGITMITLVITIILLIILTFTITINIAPLKEQSIRTNFETDITQLSTEVEQYYISKKELPILNKYTNTSMLDSVKNPNDGQDYYIIDIRKLDVNLKYGNDIEAVLQRDSSLQISDLLDVYIVNSQSHTIYYPKGIVYKGTTYYKLSETYTAIGMMNILINVQDYVGEYDGNPHTATIEARTEGVTIKYGTTAGTYDLNEIPTYTDVGTYTIYYQATKEEYETTTGSAQVVITQPILQLKVGDVVSYSPSGTYSWNNTYATSDKTGSTTLSSASGQSFNINSWKVLSIDETTGQVEMVPTAQTAGTVRLQGAQGYNNAVKLLNDACSSLYSDSSKGITARSINMDDIEKIIINKGGYNPTTYNNGNANYGSQTARAYTKANSYYPTIYGQEKNRVINGSKSTSGLGLSEQTNLISRTESSATNGYKQALTSIQPYQTYYNLSNADFSNYLGTTYKDIILPSGTSTNYWVASRCVNTNSGRCYFVVRNVNSGNLISNIMFDSYYNSGSITYYDSRSVFPVVSLSSELISGNATDGFIVN